MSNKILLSILFLYVTGVCHAQTTCKTYYDSYDNLVVNPADAYYYTFADTTKSGVRMKCYYSDGSIFSKGNGSWIRSGSDVSLKKNGRWKFYYSDGRKKEILHNGTLARLWYVNGLKAYKSRKVYSFRFKGWYFKNKFWYPNEQLKSSGLARLNDNAKYGYHRLYTLGGKRWLEEYFAKSNVQGVSIYVDPKWRIKYYISLDDLSFENKWSDPKHEPGKKKAAGKTKFTTFLEAKEGYNELIHDLDTFRFTVKNGYMEGSYYHSKGITNKRVSTGFYHRNCKTSNWKSISKGTKGALIYHYENYLKGCLHGKYLLLLNDSMLLMKGQYRHDKRVGKWLVADGMMLDTRVMGDKDSVYFREEKYCNDELQKYYSKVYKRDKNDFSIYYLKSKTKRKCFFSNATVHKEYYPNHQVKSRSVYNEKKKRGVEKTYDVSGKFIDKKQISYE